MNEPRSESAPGPRLEAATKAAEAWMLAHDLDGYLFDHLAADVLAAADRVAAPVVVTDQLVDQIIEIVCGWSGETGTDHMAVTVEVREALAAVTGQDGGAAPPAGFWREVPCGHPPDPVAWINEQDAAVCHCGWLLDPAEGAAIESAPGPVVHCDRCGCHVAVPRAGRIGVMSDITFRELDKSDGWPFPISRSIGLFDPEGRRIYSLKPSEARDLAHRLLAFTEGMADRRDSDPSDDHEAPAEGQSWVPTIGVSPLEQLGVTISNEDAAQRESALGQERAPKREDGGHA